MEENSKIMIKNVLKIEGRLEEYAAFAARRRTAYRTVNQFISKRLEELSVSKAELAAEIGTTNQGINRWEKAGFPSMEKALELTKAMELSAEEEYDFLQKYAGLREKDADTLKLGERARKYLDFYVKRTRFDKYSGNQREFTNDVWEFDFISKEDRDRYKRLYKRFLKGTYPERDELIELGIILRMTHEEVDKLLERSGYYPLSAKKIYEGALILVLAYIERICPELLCEEMQQDMPLEFRLKVSELISVCLSNLPDSFEVALKERPRWYVPEKEAFLLEKQRCATIILDMEKHILNTWIYFREDREKPIQIKESLMQHVVASLDFMGYEELKRERDAMILAEIKKIETFWFFYLKQDGILDMARQEFRALYRKWFTKIEDYYCDCYAPHMRRKGKKKDEI